MNNEVKKNLLQLFIVGLGFSLVQFPYINEGIHVYVFGTLRIIGLVSVMVTGCILLYLTIRDVLKYMGKSVIVVTVILALVLFIIYVLSEEQII